MADVLFIVPDTTDLTTDLRRDVESTKFAPPYAFMMLGALLEKDGYNVKIIDTRINKDYINLLEEELRKKPIFVGLGSMTGPQITHSLNISKAIRQIDDSIPIVWGGVHPSIFPEQTIKNSNLDIIVINEAESTILELIKKLKNKEDLSGIKGLLYKNKYGEVIRNLPIKKFVDLNDHPIPSWYLIKDNINSYLIRIFTSKGCPYECSFCYNKLYHNRKWRARSAEHVLKEVDYLKELFGITEIQIGDDNFLMHKQRAIEIIEGLIERNLTLKWCMTRANLIDEEILEKMQGICKEMSFGIESGSQKILDLIKKDLTISQIKEAARLLNKHGINYAAGFMCGFPFETEEDLIANIRLAKELHEINPNHRFVMSIYVNYPGTEMYDLMVNKYDFKAPDSLEGWAATDQYGEINPQFIPWIKDYKFYKQYQKIFISLFEMRDERIKKIYNKGLWGCKNE